MDTSDWRGQLQPEKRQRIVIKIMDTLKRHLHVSGQEGLHELRKIAQRFEEKIFTTATSQYDYLRKISIKMLIMEKSPQGTMANYIPPNQVGPNNKPPDPDEMAPKMKRSKLAELVSEGEKSGIIPSTLKDWRNDKPASSPILEQKRKQDAVVGTSQQVPGVVTHDMKLTASSSVPNVSTNVTTSIPAHNSSGPARSDVSSQQMSIPKLDDVFTRKCRSVQGEIKIKVPNPDDWIKHLPEFVDNGESASKSVWNVANSYSELVDSLTQKEDGERMNNAGDGEEST